MTTTAPTIPSPQPTRRARLRAAVIALLLPLAALAFASQVVIHDWRFWLRPEHHLEHLLVIGAYLICELLYRKLPREWQFGLANQHIDTRLSHPLTVVLVFGAVTAILDGLGVDTPARLLGSVVPPLMLGAALLAPYQAQRQVRVGIVPIGRVALLKTIDRPSVAWVALTDGTDARSAMVDAVAADLHHAMPQQWSDFIADCRLCGIPVLHSGSLYERLTGKIALRYVRDIALREVKPNRLQMTIKRSVEVMAVLATAPIWVLVGAVAMLSIRLDSPGPVFFVQERVGYHGTPFRMFKFRSMRVGADAGGPAFAAKRDPRVTRVGALLRRLRIDELPQLYNVLRGEMSLVGPRPEQVQFVSAFTQEIPFYASRHNVRPGITGWAQVKSGYAADAEETVMKLEHDLYYVRHVSVWLDAVIAWLSIRTVLTGAGAR